MLLINSILFMTDTILDIYKTHHLEGKPNIWIEQHIGIYYGLDIDLSSVKNIPQMELKEKRLYQIAFKKALVNRDKRCLITDDPVVECDGAHIIEYKICGTCTIDNGLLLAKQPHKLWDENYFNINPDTYQIELTEKGMKEETTITKYAGKKLNIPYECVKNLRVRYQTSLAINSK